MTGPIVRFENAGRQFGTLTAVSGVSLDLMPGEVLALLGENGAGKSTLMKMLYGIHPPTSGRLLIDGKTSPIRGPADAAANGIGMVFQAFSLLPALSVFDNLLLAWPKRPFWIGRGNRGTAHVLEGLHRLAPTLDPDRRVADLSVAEQQLVELAKVLNLGARVIILDEPTSVLTHAEAEALYGFIRSLSAAGAAVVLITHKMEDVEACGDRLAIMRKGELVSVTARGELSQAEIVEQLMGRSLATKDAPRHPERRRERLHLRGVNATSAGMSLADLNVEVAAGEILGIAGVAGNGQSLLAEVIAGAHPVASGDVVLDGQVISRRADDPPTATPLGYIPEQPRSAGVVEDLSVAVNLSLRQFGSAREAAVDVSELIDRFDIRPREPQLPAGKLSGGNLQKLVIARELAVPRPAVLACYPTMGLDLQASASVYAELFRQAEQGAAIVWISEDLDDLLVHAHRIAVLRGGRIVAILHNDGQLGRDEVGALMTGGQQPVLAA